MISLYCDSAPSGFKITVAAQFGSPHIARIIDLNFSEHKHLSLWHERFTARPTVQRGIILPPSVMGA